MYHFDVTIHAAPASPADFKSASLNDRDVTVLEISPAELSAPLSVRFEEVAAALELLPGLFFEPDGSFVWGKGADAQRWQVDGLLHDHITSLMTVQLRGKCPPDAFEQLLTVFRPTGTTVVFQLNRFGVFLDEQAGKQFFASDVK